MQIQTKSQPKHTNPNPNPKGLMPNPNLSQGLLHPHDILKYLLLPKGTSSDFKLV
jgi:hypothetical protein